MQAGRDLYGLAEGKSLTGLRGQYGLYSNDNLYELDSIKGNKLGGLNELSSLKSGLRGGYGNEYSSGFGGNYNGSMGYNGKW